VNASQRSARNAYAGLGLDRAHILRNDASWLAAARVDARTRFVLTLPESKLWANAAGDALQLLDPSALDVAQRAQASLLGLDDSGVAYFQIAGTPPPGRGQVLDLRALAAGADAFHAGLAAYAVALAHWQRTSRYCPACGAATEHDEGGHRARCPQCGLSQFPRTDPAVIVLVEHAGAALLGHKPGWPPGRFSTLAGFVEPGETLEDAVRREVAEESGAVVRACDYHSSQPWPFPASLMLGFTAQAASRDLAPGDGELAEVRWFTRAGLRAGLAAGTLSLPPGFSVAYHLIADWLARTR
jgi:NAD+ diphosphatase